MNNTTTYTLAALRREARSAIFALRTCCNGDSEHSHEQKVKEMELLVGNGLTSLRVRGTDRCLRDKTIREVSTNVAL